MKKLSKISRQLGSLFIVAILSLGFFVATRAQEPVSSPTPITPAIHKAELHQALLDLTNPFTVMCVAAHPDDEDGTTLTMLRRKFGVHTVSLFSTYGEGGQNAVGPQLYEELGVIRARETMAAARIQGSEPYFLGLKDFGYSKSADEAFRVWGHDEALRRMVLKIRELRPDVIITNHSVTNNDHGHHQATARLILEAFDAAADPKRFPEQLGQLKPWQAQRLFVRIFGGANTTPAATDKVVAIDPNEVDPVRNSSFAEQALAALQEHASQGPWPKTFEDLMRMRGGSGGKLPLIRYQLVREAPNAPALAADSIPLLAGLKVADSLSYHITPFKNQDALLTDFLDQPVVVLESLIEWRKSNPAVEASSPDPQRAQMMKARFDHALATAANIALAIMPDDEVLIPGNKTTFTVNLENNGDRSLEIDKISFAGWGQTVPVKSADQLLPGTEAAGLVEMVTPASAKITVPKAKHLYDGLLFGNKFVANAEIEIDGVRFDLGSERQLEVVPAIEILSVSPSPCVRTEEMLGRCEAFELQVVNHLATPFRGVTRVEISGAPGRNIVAELPLVMAPGETRAEKIAARSSLPDRKTLAELRRSGSVQISILNKDKAAINEVTVPVVYSDAHVASGLQVGYVPSFDQTIERSLAALGVAAKALAVDDIKTADLTTYSTIIIDNRGYEAHAELIVANSRLLDFVNAGGTLIVFYHKSNEWNPDPKRNRPQLAPFPILLGDERVTDETAPVKFLQPGHPLLNFPNKITLSDFDNWIQERGLYYPKEWDNHFAALFSMNDPGEKPLTGGLLVAKYGKGNYIYTSMVWYRQLRAGVPGSYRMFANMISYGHK
ncbi:MAG TPA: PIG-L family deacetylase, partial [Pyrinomonadaceae bacterium]|nr:PIG-L family deacetylase [Pyrinomonadaceae bacterium]